MFSSILTIYGLLYAIYQNHNPFRFASGVRSTASKFGRKRHQTGGAVSFAAILFDRYYQKSESEMFLFDPYKKYIQSNNETILDQGTPIKTSLVANIRAAYYIINNYFFISQAKNT